jgi:ATP/maltotriose-dependent transcriptional regulator MalT
LSEIAEELYVSLYTVISHAGRLYRRLGESTREGAVAAARERGLLDGGSRRRGEVTRARWPG